MVFYQLQFIINHPLNPMLYHLSPIIRDMYLVILYKLLLHELFDIHPHLKHFIMNDVILNLCYSITGKFRSCLKIIFLDIKYSLVIHLHLSNINFKSFFLNISPHHHFYPLLLIKNNFFLCVIKSWVNPPHNNLN